MCKYEMDPTSIVENTERTRFCPQMDRRTDRQMERQTDGQTDKVKPVYPLFNFVEAGDLKIVDIYHWLSMVLTTCHICESLDTHEAILEIEMPTC